MNLWNHFPKLSAEPIRYLMFFSKQSENNLDECGLFELDNGKYVYIRYYGLSNDPESGITELQEFFTLADAEKFWDENFL